jgi:hypothetical protein
MILMWSSLKPVPMIDIGGITFLFNRVKEIDPEVLKIANLVKRVNDHPDYSGWLCLAAKGRRIKEARMCQSV